MLEYETVGEFLANIRKEFRGKDEESIKVAELKRLEQRNKIIEKFVQEFRRAVRGSEYKGRLLMEKFKKEMNKIIKRKLMKVEYQPSLIEQWYDRAIALNKNWRNGVVLFFSR